MHTRIESFGYPFKFIAGDGLGYSYSSYTQIPHQIPYRDFGRARIELLCNVSNGNLTVVDKKLSMPDVPGPIEFSYTYNSLSKGGWIFSYGRNFKSVQKNQKIIVKESDGHETCYEYDTVEDRYIAPGHSNGTPYIKYLENGSWIWYHPESRKQEYFNAEGCLKKTIDHRGNEAFYEYDDEKNLIAIKTTGNTYEIRRTSQKIEIFLHHKNEVSFLHTYVFNDANELIKSITFDNYEICYDYSQNSTLKSVHQSDESHLSFDFLEESQKLKSIQVGSEENPSHTFAYDDHRTIFTNAIGVQTTFSVDDKLRLATVSEERGIEEASNELDITQYGYDSHNHVNKIIHPDLSTDEFNYQLKSGLIDNTKNRAGIVSQYQYEDSEQPVLVLHSDFKSEVKADTRFVFDTMKINFRILRFEISPTGRVKEYILDENTGLPKAEKEFYELYSGKNYDLFDFLIWSKSQKQFSFIEYLRDDRGQIIKKQQKDNAKLQETKLSYDLFGYVNNDIIKYSDDDKDAYISNKYLRDGCHHLTSEVIGIDTTAEQKTNYHSEGALIHTLLPNSLLKTDIHNSRGLLNSTILSVKNDENLETRVYELSYDCNGRVEKIVLPDKQEIIQIYDRQNRLSFIISPSGAVTELTYFTLERYEVKKQYAQLIDPQLILMDGKYSANKLKELLEELSDPITDRENIQFKDSAGRKQYYIDAENFLTEYRYDELGRLGQVIQYGRRLSEIELKNFRKRIIPDLTPNREYDRITSTFFDKDGEIIAEQDPAGFVTHYQRDARKLVTCKTMYSVPISGISLHYEDIAPINHEDDSKTYYFYNSFKQCILEVDAEGYITEHRYFNDNKKELSIRYANKVSNTWYEDTSQFPEIVQNVKDQTTQYGYDELRRQTQILSPLKHLEQKYYNEMNELAITDKIDFNNPNEITGDYRRRQEIRFDGWGQETAVSKPRISEKILSIGLQELSEEEKSIEIEKVWQNAAEKKFHTESGLHTVTIDENGFATLFYYDIERRPVLQIDPMGSVFKLTYNSFGDVISKTQYYKRIEDKLEELTGGYINDTIQKILEEISDPSRDSVTFYERDRRGQKIKKIDPNSYVYQYQYSAFKQRTHEKIPIKDDVYQEIQHVFDVRGSEIETTKISGILKSSIFRKFDSIANKETEIIDEVGLRKNKRYDRLNRLNITTKIIENDEEVIDQIISYDAFNRPNSKTNGEGNMIVFNYDDKTRETTTSYPIEKMKSVTKDNVFGELVETINGLGIKEKFIHAPDRQLKERIDGLGSSKKTIHDNKGQKIQELDPNNVLTTYSINSSGFLFKHVQDVGGKNLTTIYVTNVFGKNEKIIDPRGSTTIQEFDRIGELRKSILDPEGLNMQKIFNYIAEKLLTDIFEGDDKCENQVHYQLEYDGFKRRTATITDPENLKIIKTMVFDNAGNPIIETDANGLVKRKYYDLQQQKRFELQMMDDKNISAIEWGYIATNKVKFTRVYQAKVDVNDITDQSTLKDIGSIFTKNPYDTVNYFYYDANDQERFKLKILYSPEEKSYYGIIEEKQYDLAGRPIAHIRYSQSIPINDISLFSTKVLEEILIHIKNLEEDRATYTWYDNANEVRFIVDQNGRVTEKAYSPTGKKIFERQYAITIDTPELLIGTNEYEFAAHVLRSDTDRTSYFVYDNLGYEIFSVDANGGVIRTDYDENHNVLSTTIFKQKIMVPDSYDQLVEDLKDFIPNPECDSISKISYDKNNKTIIKTDALGNKDLLQYDAVGNNTKTTNRSNQSTHCYYDRAKRATLEVLPKAPYTTVTRDDKGKLQYKTEEISPQKAIKYDKCNNKAEIEVSDGRDKKRIVKSTYNAYAQTTGTLVPNVSLNDEKATYNDSWKKLSTLPNYTTDVTTNTIHDAKSNIIAEKDENNNWNYAIYDSLNRLIFTIGKEGELTQYVRNNFGEVTKKIQYAKPIHVDFDKYRYIGFPAEIILENLETDKNDRVTYYYRNQLGKTYEQISSEIFYFSRDEYGFARPTSRWDYNTFGDMIYEAKLIRPDFWAEKRFWHDNMKNIIAEINENNYLTCYDYNTSNKPTTKHEYAEPFLIQPECSTDVSALKNLITPSEKDRIYQYVYDLLQQQKFEILLNVETQSLLLDEKNIPSIVNNPIKKLVKEWSFSPTQKVIQIKHPDGGTDNIYYDSADNKIAESKPFRQFLNENGEKVSLLPMTLFKVDVFGKVNVTSTSPRGGEILEGIPQLLLDDRKDLIQDVILFDNRGLASLKQDGELHLSGFTYTPTRKVSRELREASNWEDIVDEKSTPTRVSFIDEKAMLYDCNDQPLSMDYRRNGKLEESTYNKFNMFGEFIGEGPTQNSYPAFSSYDNSGNRWFTNTDKGINHIILCDLRGVETLRLAAPKDNLADIDYSDIAALLHWGPDRIDRTETIHDNGGRPIAHKTPLWFKDRNAYPSRSYRHDRWNNEIKEINSFGYETDYSFNHLDKLLQCLQPEVDVYLENMVMVRMRPLTIHGHNELGFEIGVRDANGHVTGYVVDNAGNCLNKILADGTVDETAIFDALNRPTHTADARKKLTHYSYTSRNQVAIQQFPSGRKHIYSFDEQNNRISQADPAGNVLRYNHDIKNNIDKRFLPLGQATTLGYDRNYVKTSEINPDGSKMSWETDYFGNLLMHKDLSNRIINHVLNFNKKVIRLFSQADIARKMLLMNASVNSCGWYGHSGKLINTTPEDIDYEYQFGMLYSAKDKLSDKMSLYTHNSEGNRISAQNKKSQVLMNEIISQYDELNREKITDEKIFEASGYYSLAQSTKGYDAVGNTRMDLFKLNPTCIFYAKKCMSPEQKSAFYHLYDPADRIKVLDGKLINGKIEQGILFSYKDGFRVKEDVYESGVVDIGYDDDGMLILTKADNGMETMRIYDVARWTKEYQESLDNKTTLKQLNFNANGWQLLDDCWENNVKQSSMSYSDFTPLGLPKKQSIYDYKNKTNDVYDITYLGLDRWVQSKVTGVRNGSKTIGTAELWHDSHGIINGKSWATQDEPQYKRGNSDPFPNKAPLYFETTLDGQILGKQYITQDTSTALEYDNFYHYLHNAEGDLISGYCFLYDSSYMNGHPTPQNPNHSPYYYPKVTDIYPYHLPQSVSLFQIADKNKKMDPSWKEVTSDIIPFSPQIYIVNQGDTFASIAKKMFGDHRYGNKIAYMNGMIHVNSPKQGLLLQLPQIIPERNKFDTTCSRPYHMFIDHLTGNLLPKFQGHPHRHKHHGSFFASLIKIVVVGLIVIVAPLMGPALLGIAGIAINATSSFIAAAVAAAMMDAAAQGLAILTGMQSQFSITEMIETGMSGGCMSFGMEAQKTIIDAAKAALRVSTVQVLTQLVEMAAGIRDKFDARAIGMQIAATLVGFEMGKFINFNNILIRNIASTTLNVILDRAINDSHFNIENIALQIAGAILTEFTSSLIPTNSVNVSADTPTSTPQTVQVEVNPELEAAERVAQMAMPEAKLNFQNVSGSDIRQSRVVRWQTESSKRSTWADKHPESQAKNLVDQINQSQVPEKKGFMDYVRDFNNTVETIVVKPVIAMGDSIIQDVNTLIYNDSLSAKALAAGSLALDGAMIIAPEINLAKAAASSLSKFGLWGGAVEAESLNLGINNHINRLRLQQQLSIEEQAALFNSTFGLSEAAIENSRLILPGKNLKNPKLINDLSAIGGELSDWGKYTTDPIHTLSGQAEVHFYRNPVTGNVFYGRDYKSIFNHQGNWKVEASPKFNYEPN